MHEISVVRSLCKTVLDFAETNGIDRIGEIVCDNGELSLVINEYVYKCYPFVTKGTILEKTKLTINSVPGLAECRECDEIFNVIEHEGYCPNCGSFEKDVLTGREFMIREILVPEEE